MQLCATVCSADHKKLMVAVKHGGSGSVRVEAFPAAILHTMSASDAVAGAVMLIHCDIPLLWRQEKLLPTHRHLAQPPVIRQHGTEMQDPAGVTVCAPVCACVYVHVCMHTAEVLKAH